MDSLTVARVSLPQGAPGCVSDYSSLASLQVDTALVPTQLPGTTADCAANPSPGSGSPPLLCGS